MRIERHYATTPWQVVASVVRDVGFPIVVASVLLYSFVVRLPDEVGRLTHAIEAQMKSVDTRLQAIEDRLKRALEGK